MSITISNKRYAQAVFLVAKESSTFEEWQQDLKKIAELMRHKEFVDIIDNPKVPFALKAKLAHSLLGKINDLALNFIYLLITKNKFKDSVQIADEYDNLLNEYYGIKRASVVTAIEIEETDKNNLGRKLENFIGSKAKIQFTTDPLILGGFIARVNGSLIDGSVRNKLDMLRKNIS
jgi:F-type H+-transporting ATPase subunit delta